MTQRFGVCETRALFGRTSHSRVKREFREEITNLAVHWLNVNCVGRCPRADVGLWGD